jgi:CheY-like chemotaxis protein
MAIRLSPAATIESSVRERSRTLLSGVRVLIVDDQRDVLSLVGTIFRRQGAEVKVADSVGAGLAHVEHERPDVCICDIGMPVEDGFDFIRKMKALAEVPAIALSAHGQHADVERAITAGFKAHMTKPADAGELVAVVAQLVGRGDGETSPSVPGRSRGERC